MIFKQGLVRMRKKEERETILQALQVTPKAFPVFPQVGPEEKKEFVGRTVFESRSRVSLP
jgi:hypothetical protein